jgi:energy-converting hydrogenase Eha subunit A
MRRWIFEHLSMAIVEAILLLIVAAVMIAVIYTLRESLPVLSHPWARRLGWRRSLVFLLFPAVPFWNSALGYMLIPALYALTAFQVERMWLIRGLGTEPYLSLMRRAAAKSSRQAIVLSNLGAGLLLVISASALWFTQPNPTRDWGFWFAAGLAVYAVLNGYARTRAVLRLREAPAEGAT